MIEILLKLNPIGKKLKENVYKLKRKKPNKLKEFKKKEGKLKQKKYE